MTSSSETSSQTDPAERTVALLLSRGLTTKEASDWGEGAQSEEEAQEIATWLERHPQAEPLEILSMLIEVLIPVELRHPCDIGSKLIDVVAST